MYEGQADKKSTEHGCLMGKYSRGAVWTSALPVVLAETEIKENVIEGAVHTFRLLIGVCVRVCVCMCRTGNMKYLNMSERFPGVKRPGRQAYY